MPPPSPVPPPPSQPRPALSLLDSTSIIVGIIIGSAIYRIPSDVVRGAGNWAVGVVDRLWGGLGPGVPSDEALAGATLLAVIGIWVLGGLIALLGAMCYAELATAFPQAGGTYVYLSEAFGRSTGFAFAWVEFWIVRPGNIGAVAFVMASYGEQLLPAWRGTPGLQTVLAAGAISLLALLNAAGLQAGKGTQNLLTALKVIGLGAIVLTAFTVRPPADAAALPANLQGSIVLALINIMFAYGGWADMSFVAAEVRQPERNIFRALLLGTGAVTAIYLLVNFALIFALGMGGLARSSAAAADVLALRFGEIGARSISVLVVVSCLGAMNGMLFTGVRAFYALGTQHPIFRWLGAWNDRTGVPLRSLAAQTAVALALVIGFGRNPAAFDRLVVFTGPFYWGFIGLVGVALIVLRTRGRSGRTTYRVPLFPLTPLLFALSSGAMVYAGLDYALHNMAAEAAWAAGVIALGIVVGIFDWRSRSR